ncbi:helix-turn-helix domain-containing protein [Brucella pseudogrignonensis]|uniref:helix-turn-helix domain-containing protein n=1 Tax=Brucella pseudogrignonensis TaxID=419475 RepID=UPI003ECD230C
MKHLVENAVETAAFPDRGEKFPILGKDTSLFVTTEVKTIRSSQRHGWQDLFAAHTLEHPHECLHHSVPFFWLSMGLRETEVHRSIGGRGELAVLPAYSISMAEPLTAVDCLIGNATEAVHVFLRPELLQETAYELFEIEPDRVSLLPVFGRTSTSLSWLLRAIKQSLAEPANLSQLKIDYLARALCADLLAKYSVVSPAAIKPDRYGGLTSRQLRRIDDYITEHLTRDIHIGELASLSGMGRTSFHQRFKAATHITPHQYVMRVRVQKAKEMLGTSVLPLAEIGFACGFSDQAHFATLFKRIAGTTPASFRRSVA